MEKRGFIFWGWGVLARRPRTLAYGGGGPTTRLVCGYLACDARFARLLLAGLPPLVRVNVRGSDAGAWLDLELLQEVLRLQERSAALRDEGVDRADEQDEQYESGCEDNRPVVGSEAKAARRGTCDGG